MASGIIAGVAAYAGVLIPVTVMTAPSDVSAGESLSFALFFGIPLGIAVLLGSIAGSAIGAGYHGLRVIRRAWKHRA